MEQKINYPSFPFICWKKAGKNALKLAFICPNFPQTTYKSTNMFVKTYLIIQHWIHFRQQITVMLVLALKNSTKLCWISNENFGNSPTIPHFLCTEFMQMNVQGFVGMHRRNMTVVYVIGQRTSSNMFESIKSTLKFKPKLSEQTNLDAYWVKTLQPNHKEPTNSHK